MSKFSDLTKRKTAEPPQELNSHSVTEQQVGRPLDPDSLTQQLKRGEAKQLKAIIPNDLHKQIKLASVQLERDISEITSEALEHWLKKNDK